MVPRDNYARNDALRRRDLIRAHDKQRLVRIEYAIARQDVQKHMLRKERSRKIDEILNRPIFRVGPPAREFERIGRELAPHQSAALRYGSVELVQVP